MLYKTKAHIVLTFFLFFTYLDVLANSPPPPKEPSMMDFRVQIVHLNT